jgi:hypothetical protein
MRKGIHMDGEALVTPTTPVVIPGPPVEMTEETWLGLLELLLLVVVPVQAAELPLNNSFNRGLKRAVLQLPAIPIKEVIPAILCIMEMLLVI